MSLNSFNSRASLKIGKKEYEIYRLDALDKAGKFFQECLTKWKQEYDHVLIDTPPVLSVTDAVVLSVYADSVVLVVRSDVTTKNALRQARDLLLQVNARVTGTLLNGVDLTSPGSYYYYYAYGYGQKNRYYNESRQSESRQS